MTEEKPLLNQKERMREREWGREGKKNDLVNIWVRVWRELLNAHTRHARNVMCVYYQETEQFTCALNTHTYTDLRVCVWIYYDDVTHTHTSLEGNELLVDF